MNFTFQKATKKQLKSRVAIDGPSGSGKTYTALVAATALAQGAKIAVIDTERGSARLYSDKFTFDVLELTPPFSPEIYTQAISAAEEAGYPVIVIDSLSHAWEGEGGALDMADDATKKMRNPNSYAAWREVTPLHRKMVDAILQSPAHIVATMRSKMDYEQTTDSTGKKVVNKLGLAPIQRAGMEYEFTMIGDMDVDHNIIISKSRCDFMADKVAKKPTVAFFKPFVDWLNDGEVGKPESPQPQPTETKAPAPTTDKPAPELDPTLGKDWTVGHSDQIAQPEAQTDPFATTRNLDPKNLTLEEAKAVRSGTNGHVYGELPIPDLAARFTSMTKMLKDKSSLSGDDIHDYEVRIAAVKLILKEHNSAK